MFFIMGIFDGQKEIKYDGGGMNICKLCGAYCSYRIFCTYMCFTLFFIPIFKWSKQYYAECSSCNKLFKLNKELGRRIERGENVLISPDDLEPENSFYENRERKCENCGYTVREDFEYCPKCGKRI
ncbi:MAG: zinc ribbon domain-containing protein [Clostridia bacterium]|nr:zinc ribbon domain-containing protein [Clostridia bacterium]